MAKSPKLALQRSSSVVSFFPLSDPRLEFPCWILFARVYSVDDDSLFCLFSNLHVYYLERSATTCFSGKLKPPPVYTQLDQLRDLERFEVNDRFVPDPSFAVRLFMSFLLDGHFKSEVTLIVLAFWNASWPCSLHLLKAKCLVGHPISY